jgi:class 3 adenylate cyclase/tetratricopeptide (TPR) repeat protein
MTCPQCRFENPPGMRFCGQCGSPLARRCAQCGTEAPAGFRFCGHCGASLTAETSATARVATPPGPPSFVADAARPSAAYTPKHLADKILKGRSALEGERRQVTVLFADVAGFTTLAEKLDPEEVHRLIERCFEAITTEVHRFEGTVNQYTGDGVMALFGAPIAHEDSARRAVHAALGIQRAIREVSQLIQAERGLSLEMRIGLNTGPVVVGKIGDDLRMDYTAVGDTTNLAARMQQTARPGSVRLSEATHRVVAGFFETLDLGVVEIKGHAPVRAFEALRARGRVARLDVAVERGLTPLVGREREVETLVGLFAHVKAGRGQVVSIVGDAGIGKSRVLYEFRRRLAEASENATWLEGRSVSFGQSIPFLPLADQLRESFGIQEFDGEPEIIAKVEHGMRRIGGVDEHIGYVRYLLSVDPGDPAIAAMEAAARRKKTLDAVRALAVRAAGRRPIVFVFEDLHWIDTSTEDYIGLLVDSLAGMPIMLVLTYRPGYVPRFGTRSFHTAITLAPMSNAEALRLASGVLGGGEFPAELATALGEKAGGVPLFVEEVTKTLLDIGILRRENGGYRLAKRLDEVSVPDTIHDIIMARLDRLGEHGKRTVQLASVIGRQFMHRLLERITGLTGELEGLLSELKSLEIIYEQGLLAEPAYIFKHAVIQDVAYNSLLLQRRKELHRAVGHAIEELYPDRLAEHYAELAHHFFQAESWPKAMEYSVFAGRRAGDSFANAEARDHFARALEAAQRMSPPPEPRALCDVYSRSGAVLMALGQYQESVAAYEAAVDLARRIGDRRLEADLLIALGGVYNFYHRPDRALEHLDQALAMGRESGDTTVEMNALGNIVLTRNAGFGLVRETFEDSERVLELEPRVADPRARAHALIAVGTSLQWRGEYARARAILERGVALANDVHAGFMAGLANFHLCNAALSLGHYEEALTRYRALYDYAQAAGDRFALVRAANSIAAVHLELFDLAEAIRISVESEELTQKVFPWPEPRAHSLIKASAAHLGRGDIALAEELLDRARTLFDIDVWGRWRWHMVLLRQRGEIALARGRLDEAWTHAGEALAAAERSEATKHKASALRLRGQVLIARGDLDDAAKALAESAALADRIGTVRERWIASEALGALAARRGHDAEAERHYRRAVEAVDTIVRGLTTPALRRSFLTAEHVRDLYRTVGRALPEPDA